MGCLIQKAQVRKRELSSVTSQNSSKLSEKRVDETPSKG
jgi:hypothetical protein